MLWVKVGQRIRGARFRRDGGGVIPWSAVREW